MKFRNLEMIFRKLIILQEKLPIHIPNRFRSITIQEAGKFQAGLYPVSANVPLGGQTGATPDGRYAHTPVADGVSPSAGKDVKGPTAAATSVSRLDHFIVSNGTLFNQKFHPSALSGREGLEKFVALIRGYFDQKGMHMQFNVVDRQTLLDAQEHPEKYKHLVVRVAGYSALFTTLSRSLQDDIIRRTEQGFLIQKFFAGSKSDRQRMYG